VITRYTRPEMGAIWTDEARMERWRQVEVAAAEELEGPTAAELDAIRAATLHGRGGPRARTGHRSRRRRVRRCARGVGRRARALDPLRPDLLRRARHGARAAAPRRRRDLILAGARELVAALSARAREHAQTLCVGRTHGIHAEPTTFGLKLAGFAFEAQRNVERLERAFADVAVGAISGAVGTHAGHSPAYEARVLARLGLDREPISTQVVARDRHAELLGAIALAGAGLERLATEVRHLQRTEVAEAQEPFRAGEQKGSSSMPHKRNPIISERITGLARVLRATPRRRSRTSRSGTSATSPTPASSGSSCPTRRSCSTTCSTSRSASSAASSSTPSGCAQNLELTHGALFSGRVLSALVDSGLSRDDAYRITQELAQRAFTEHAQLRELIAADPRTSALDTDAIFDYGAFTRHVPELIARLDMLG
jgi:adenylosuccinate lyase